jgi:cell fate regulator YaaT (PSP1 superfamily)
VGDYVIVEGDRGQDMGRVLEVLPLKGTSVARVVSIATTKERDTLLALRKEEGAAVRLCQQRVKEHGLRMKIEDVEFQYDGGKVTIYYSSNCAIDFRQLQRQLFRDFRCRVWLRTVPASS